MLKKILGKLFAKLIYPTKRRNWYKNKGYHGDDEMEQFNNFVLSQKNKDAIFYKEFRNLKLKRQFINSGDHRLDSVMISVTNDSYKTRERVGLCFVFFQGKNEYYESRFRDMAKQCKETGLSVLGFNPKGMGSSSGKTRNIDDLVSDGIEIINYLLYQGRLPEQIILQGNSLGGGIIEMVSKYFKNTSGFSLKQINSNSFKSISAVFVYQYGLAFLERPLRAIMLYSGWEIRVDRDFYTTGPHRFYFRRFGDRTIINGAEYHSMINHDEDYTNCPEYFQETNRLLNAHNQLILKNETDKDPHDLSLNKFVPKPLTGDKSVYTIYDLINQFLISNH
jgi:hypothetical protein